MQMENLSDYTQDEIENIRRELLDLTSLVDATYARISEATNRLREPLRLQNVTHDLTRIATLHNTLRKAAYDFETN